MANPRPAPFFIADDVALDFLNTIASPWGAEIEWLANGADLVVWLDQAACLPADVAAQFRAQAGTRALDAVAGEARELREWFRGFAAKHAGRALERRALCELAPLNELLGCDEAYWEIEYAPPAGEDGADNDAHALQWRTQRRWSNPRTLLLPLAHAMGDLICEKDFSLVRRCEGQGCTLWFLDVSKAHARRWCSMAVCGNRAKAAAHRARTRQRPTAR
jgi:predicted RNA-binding Zn ribbon-like protein